MKKPGNRTSRAWLQRGCGKTGHFARPVQRGELDELRRWRRLHFIDHARQRHADERHDHRPALDAPVAVHTLFEALEIDEVLDRIVAWLRDHTVHLDRP